jgi:hypothetical protein
LLVKALTWVNPNFQNFMTEFSVPVGNVIKPNLIYTVAFDRPGWRGGRTMAKLLCASLLRHFWGGEIVVFRNFPEPLFPVERKGLEEIHVETSGSGDENALLLEALEFRFKAADWLDPGKYGWMAYLDADCLGLRNLDHLFTGDADILVQPERGRELASSHVFNGYIDYTETPVARRNAWIPTAGNGINAGTFAVTGAKYAEVMETWKTIYGSTPARHEDMRDQTAWNRLLLDTELRARPFERGEVMFPLHLDKGFLDYRDAALLHFVGGKQRDKIDLAFALHMMRTYGDAGGLFLDLLEA